MSKVIIIIIECISYKQNQNSLISSQRDVTRELYNLVLFIITLIWVFKLNDISIFTFYLTVIICCNLCRTFWINRPSIGVGNHSKTCKLSNNMKCTIVLLAVFVPLIFAASLPESLSTFEIPDSIRTLNELYRGPPKQHTNLRSNVQTRWINQKLDNFDDDNDKEWKDVSALNLLSKLQLKREYFSSVY